MISSLASFSPAQQASTVYVGIVYSTGGLGDQSFNDMAKSGVELLRNDYPDLVIDEACTSSCTVADVSTALDDFASSATDYNLIIGIGFSSEDGVKTAANNHPAQNFLLIDAVVDLPNVASVVFREHEGSFLAGAMAGLIANTSIGFLGGLDIPLINKFGVGFIEGARYVDPYLGFFKAYSPDPNNPWGDLAGGQQVANDMLTQGVEIIYAATGGTGLGVLDEVEIWNGNAEGRKYYYIGVDSNQDGISPGNVLTSMVKRIDVVVYSQVEAIIRGSWYAGTQGYGLIEDGVGITNMEFTQEEANRLLPSGITYYDYVMQLKQDIIDGRIEVPMTFDNVADQWIKNHVIGISSISGQLSFNVTSIELQPDTEYTIVYENLDPSYAHNIRIDLDQDLISGGDSNDPDDLLVGPPNDSDSGFAVNQWSVNWKTPSTYETIVFYCGYAGHYDAGMQGEFIINGTKVDDSSSDVSSPPENPTTGSGDPPASIDLDLPVLIYSVITGIFIATFMIRRKHRG